MSFMPAAEMQRTIKRFNALFAMIMPNSNSLNSLLLPEARCNEDTIGTLGLFPGRAKLAFTLVFMLAFAPALTFFLSVGIVNIQSVLSKNAPACINHAGDVQTPYAANRACRRPEFPAS